MKYISASFTHPGYEREINEDSYLIDNESSLWIVCDGMGGHEKGNFASRLVTDIFLDFKVNQNIEITINMIEKQIHLIHNILIEKFKDDNAIIGTTFTLLHINNTQAVCIYLGDTRCYSLNEGGMLKQINKDHCKIIMNDNQERKVLTSAISSNEELDIDIIRFDIEEDEKFLLCTDGLYDNIKLEDILDSLANNNDKEGLNSLKDKVLKTTADDNITAIQIGRVNEY